MALQARSPFSGCVVLSGPKTAFVSMFFRYDDPSKLMTGKKTVLRPIGSNLICPHIALLMDISYIRTINHGKDNRL